MHDFVSAVTGGDESPILVVGAGPVGQKVAQELSRRGLRARLINGESWRPYNRIKLSTWLADANGARPNEEFRPSGPGEVDVIEGQRIADIQPDRRTVVLESGEALPYSKLLLCVGARAFVPPIPGIETGGVFTFRDLDDVQQLDRRARVARRAVVLGGGLLGLEAARGLAERGVETWILETAPVLMARQLDRQAGELLGSRIEQLGIVVRTGQGVTRVLGTNWVEGVELTDGSTIDCDMLVVCAGIRPNTDLAARAGIAIGRGILVDEGMRTNDPHILAAGDCTEFDGMVTGLVAPGLEQARIMVDTICGGNSRFKPVDTPTKLKVTGVDVFSLGDVSALEADPGVRKLVYDDHREGLYRVVFVRDASILGVLGVGPWPELSRIQEALRQKQRIRPWQIWWFGRTGRFWTSEDDAGVQAMPDSFVVCNCTGVTRGQIGAAIVGGCRTYEDIKRTTGASTVCGACKPTIEELLGGKPTRSPVEGHKPLATASLAACAAGLALAALPAIPFASSVTRISFLDHLWTDSLLRQITGFTLLAFAVLLGLLSARKRLPKLQWGSYKGWRLVHAAAGALAVLFLYAHTGGRWGSNLNFWMMASFVGIALAGGLVGLATAFEHRIASTPRAAAKLRKSLFWLHILAAWPLPTLLLTHVLVSYVF